MTLFFANLGPRTMFAQLFLIRKRFVLCGTFQIRYGSWFRRYSTYVNGMLNWKTQTPNNIQTNCTPKNIHFHLDLLSLWVACSLFPLCLKHCLSWLWGSSWSSPAAAAPGLAAFPVEQVLSVSVCSSDLSAATTAPQASMARRRMLANLHSISERGESEEVWFDIDLVLESTFPPSSNIENLEEYVWYDPTRSLPVENFVSWNCFNQITLWASLR